MSNRAVILAGGKGTRLRPYTIVLPKPLMPVGDYSILEVIIRQLAHFGVNNITLAVNHQAELLRSYFGDGSRWNVKIEHSLEQTSLGTMGPLRLIPDLPENFLVMNGDVLSDLDFKRLFHDHVASGALFTISSKIREQAVDYGVLDVNGKRELAGFNEKPKLTYEVSMGVYVVNRRVLDFIPAGTPYGFDRLMLDLLAAGEKVNVRRHDGYWLDIGRPDDYMQAIEEFSDMKARLLFG
jgi:NDP-sugar pyrophosphorylase family protein